MFSKGSEMFFSSKNMRTMRGFGPKELISFIVVSWV